MQNPTASLSAIGEYEQTVAWSNQAPNVHTAPITSRQSTAELNLNAYLPEFYPSYQSHNAMNNVGVYKGPSWIEQCERFSRTSFTSSDGNCSGDHPQNNLDASSDNWSSCNVSMYQSAFNFDKRLAKIEELMNASSLEKRLAKLENCLTCSFLINGEKRLNDLIHRVQHQSEEMSEMKTWNDTVEKHIYSLMNELKHRIDVAEDSMKVWQESLITNMEVAKFKLEEEMCKIHTDNLDVRKSVEKAMLTIENEIKSKQNHAKCHCKAMEFSNNIAEQHYGFTNINEYQKQCQFMSNAPKTNSNDIFSLKKEIPASASVIEGQLKANEDVYIKQTNSFNVLSCGDDGRKHPLFLNEKQNHKFRSIKQLEEIMAKLDKIGVGFNKDGMEIKEGSRGKQNNCEPKEYEEQCKKKTLEAMSPKIIVNGQNHTYHPRELLELQTISKNKGWPKGLDKKFQNNDGRWDPEEWLKNIKSSKNVLLPKERITFGKINVPDLGSSENRGIVSPFNKRLSKDLMDIRTAIKEERCTTLKSVSAVCQEVQNESPKIAPKVHLLERSNSSNVTLSDISSNETEWDFNEQAFKNLEKHVDLTLKRENDFDFKNENCEVKAHSPTRSSPTQGLQNSTSKIDSSNVNDCVQLTMPSPEKPENTIIHNEEEGGIDEKPSKKESDKCIHTPTSHSTEMGSKKTKRKKSKQVKSKKVSNKNLQKVLSDAVNDECNNDIPHDESIIKVDRVMESPSNESISNNSTVTIQTSNLTGFEGSCRSKPSDSDKESVINQKELYRYIKEHINTENIPTETQCVGSDREIASDDEVFSDCNEETLEEILEQYKQENSNCVNECPIPYVSEKSIPVIKDACDKDLSTIKDNMHTSTAERPRFCCSYSKRQSKSSSSSENSNQTSFANCGRCTAKKEMREERFNDMKRKREARMKNKDRNVVVYTTGNEAEYSVDQVLMDLGEMDKKPKNKNRKKSSL